MQVQVRRTTDNYEGKIYPFHHFSLVAQWCPNFCDPMYFSTSGFTLFSLWLHLFILSGVISPFFSSSVLGTYQPEEFIFQWHVFLPFPTVHVVLKARILKWFDISFSSGSRFVRTLHHDPSVQVGPTQHGSQFH